MGGLEPLDEKLRDPWPDELMDLDEKVHSRQRRRHLRIEQLHLATLTVDNDEGPSYEQRTKNNWRQPTTDVDVADTVQARCFGTETPGLPIDVMSVYLRSGEPGGEPDRVVALGSTDVDDERRLSFDQPLDGRPELHLVGPRKQRDHAPGRCLPREANAFEWPAQDTSSR